MAKLRVHISFPDDKIQEPVIYQIGHEYKLVTNIRKADVTEKIGWIDLELSGDPEEIERGIEGLKRKGVKVDLIEKNIIE